MTLRIGPYTLDSCVILAPMAGVTDRPFRQLCRQLGAGMAVSEMVSCNSLLQGSAKTLRRANHVGEPLPRSVQIAGAHPEYMAQAAQINADAGAEIIDINMGCPAKKVCNTLAGSALLRDEALVAQILQAVVKSVKIPVTLKIRTGWDPQHRNGVRIAQIAEDCGIQALSVHGRTRNCFYMGDAEYDTIAQIKSAVKIPIIANGDITSPEKAAYVLEKTQADGVMIGRAAQGKPWIFREIHHYLTTGQHLAPPTAQEVHTLLREHTQRVYDFYGEKTGVLIARKHVSWYSKGHVQGARFREAFNKLDSIEAQQALMDAFFTGIFL